MWSSPHGKPERGDCVVNAAPIIAIVLATGSAGAGIWLTRNPEADRPGPERAILERRVEALERMVAAGQAGRLVRFDQGLVVIDRPVIQDLLDAAMPYHTQVADRFRIRILKAHVSCEEGLALVRLDGRASFLDRPEDEVYLDATLYGALQEFDLERDESVIRGRVDILAFDVHRVMVDSKPSEALEGLLRDLGELRIETFRGPDFAFDIPVRLVHEILLPEMEMRQGVRIPEARVPIQASVTDVTALEDRLWISFGLRESGAEARRIAVRER